jgi:hypothetical protein
MKKQIWKYRLEVTGWQSITMPKGSEILTVQVQDGEPCLWALVDPDAGTEERFIEMVGTGRQIPTDSGSIGRYVSTFQMHGGSLVLHAFEYGITATKNDGP